MGSLSTRRVVRRSAPAKITVVGGKGFRGDGAEKENLVNCSLYSLFETHYERCNKSPLKAHSQESAGGTTEKRNTVLQPRKRLLNNRAASPVAEHSRELTPPELTTSDTFKPAKRILASNNKPGDDAKRTLTPNNKAVDEGVKQLPHYRTLSPITRESCDVLVSSPTKLSSTTTPDLIHSRAVTSGRRDVTKKTPAHGRRLSIPKLSVAREGGAQLVSKKDRNPIVKRSALTAETAVGYPIVHDGKDMVFVALRSTPSAEQMNRVETGAERPRLRILERRKSIGHKMTPLGKQGIGSFGGRSDILKKSVAEKTSAAAPQPTNLASKNTSDSVRTRRLAMVLKSEQRLTEKNEQYGIQLRQLQTQIEERDQEVEKLRSAALMLNNLINRQGDEIRELRFRLKETFNENSQVRHVCETLERDLRKTRESLRLERLQKVFTVPHEPNLVSLTSQLQSLTVCMEPPVIESCIEEGQEYSESQEDLEIRDEFGCSEDPQAESKPIIQSPVIESCIEEGQECSESQEDLEGRDQSRNTEDPKGETKTSIQCPVIESCVEEGREYSESQEESERCRGESRYSEDLKAESKTTIQELPLIQTDQDAQFTLQDLQEMVTYEEDLLKERCVDALRELNLPLAPFLTSKGSLDVRSLKTTLVSISSMYSTPDRIRSIRNLSAWLGLS